MNTKVSLRGLPIPELTPIRRLLLLVALLLPLAACERAAPPFRVGTNIWIGYESLYLAESLGEFRDTPIRIVTMPNATQVMHALRAGMIEAAPLTLDETLRLARDVPDLRVILVFDVSKGADVLVARNAIASLPELRGRRIGVEATAVGATLLHGALEAAGLQLSDVELVHLTVDQHVDAFRTQTVDAVVTFEPVRTQLLKLGARQLFDSSRIPGQIVDVLVTTEKNAQRYPDILRRLVAGHIRALRHFNENPLAAAGAMVKRQGISPREILDSFEGLELPDLEANRRYFSGPSSPLSVTADRLMKIMVDLGMLDRPMETDRLFDDRWLPPDDG